MALALTVGLGVAALPISWGWWFRVASAFVAFVATVQVFARAPNVSKRLVEIFAGWASALFAVVVLGIVIIILAHPKFHPSAKVETSLSHLLAAAASSAAIELLVTLPRVQRQSLLFTRLELASFLVAGMVINGAAGVLTFISASQSGGPVQDSMAGAIFAGLIAPLVVRACTSQMPRIIRDED
jgi:hypothetical protein